MCVDSLPVEDFSISCSSEVSVPLSSVSVGVPDVPKGSILVTIQTRDGLHLRKCNFRLSWLETAGREVGGFMLTISGLKNFYYLPDFHDMRCKAPRISEIISTRYHRDPLNGDVYIFISKDQKKVKMVHYERHAYYLHEKRFTGSYRFMRIELDNDVFL